MGLFSKYESSKSVGDLLGGIKSEFNLDEIIAKERIKENVDKLFGRGLEDKVKILKLENGVLTIICESSSWREELKLRHDKIVNQTNDFLKETILQRIEIK